MDILEWLKVILYGIVEGITEWLPISSTGHLLLLDDVLPLDITEEFMNVFKVVIQLGAILAVVVIYFGKLWPFHTKAKEKKRSQFANPDDNSKFQRFANHYLYMDKIVLWLKIAVSCLPALIIGLPLDDWLDAHSGPIVIAAMLIIYGVLFIVIENYNKQRTPQMTRLKDIDFKTALLIGVFQVLALIPGTSRSGATIIGGILLGTSRELAAEYTFFLGIPVMFGASLIKMVKFGLGFTGLEIGILLLAMAVAFAVSVLAIKFLMQYIKKHDFKAFGWYRIVLGIVVIIYFCFLEGKMA